MEIKQGGGSTGPKEDKVERKYPHWVLDTDQCMWCNRYNPVAKVYANDDRTAVIVEYVCKNKECRCLDVLHTQSVNKYIVDGEGAVEAFERRKKLYSMSQKGKVPEYEIE